MQNPHRCRCGVRRAASKTCAGSGAKNFAHRTQKHGDVETTDTTVYPQQGTTETGITSAPTNCTTNAHFSPAKAMAVSIPHRHKRAKAIAVSDHRATWSTEPGCGTSRYQCAHCPENSHAIRLGEVSTKAGNAAIPTLRSHGLKEPRENCMRN